MTSILNSNLETIQIVSRCVIKECLQYQCSVQLKTKLSSIINRWLLRFLRNKAIHNWLFSFFQWLVVLFLFPEALCALAVFAFLQHQALLTSATAICFISFVFNASLSFALASLNKSVPTSIISVCLVSSTLSFFSLSTKPSVSFFAAVRAFSSSSSLAAFSCFSLFFFSSIALSSSSLLT